MQLRLPPPSDAAPATTAVCICGELRTAVCHAKDQASPLLTIARLVRALGAMRFDVFSVLDTPRTRGNATTAARVMELLTRLHGKYFAPARTEVAFADAAGAEAEYERLFAARSCVRPFAVYQASKLAKCWRMVLARETATRRLYAHVVRARPDVVLPPSIAGSVQRFLRRATPTTTPVNNARRRAPATTATAPPSHEWGDSVCVRLLPPEARAPHGAPSCQAACLAAERSRPADVLTLPPFSATLKAETFINDIFYVARRDLAEALFDHMHIVAELSPKASPAAQPRAADGEPSAGAGRREARAGCAASAARLLASPWCSPSSSSGGTLVQCSGGHECMLSNALSAVQARQRRGASPGGSTARPRAVVVRYLDEARVAPRVLRFDEADAAQCGPVAALWICTEKLKLRGGRAAAAPPALHVRAPPNQTAGSAASSWLDLCREEHEKRAAVRTMKAVHRQLSSL